MWVKVRQAPNLIVAEMWKLLLESEGVPTRILPVQAPEADSTGQNKGTNSTDVSPGSTPTIGVGVEMKEFVPYQILVPQFRVHVYEEILRKL